MPNQTSSVPRLCLASFLLAFCAAQLWFAFALPAGWDEAVYAGMANYLASLGQAGFWEPGRPPGLPLLLVPGVALGAAPLVIARVLGIVASVSLILLCYVLAGRGWPGLAAAVLIGLNNSFFSQAWTGFTDILSTALAVGSLLLVRRAPFAAGALAGLAGLTRFVQGLALIPAALALRSRPRKIAMMGAGAATIGLPWLAANKILLGSPAAPLFEAAKAIGPEFGWLYAQGPAFYLFVLGPLAAMLALAALTLISRPLSRLEPALWTATLLFLAFFSFLPHKEARYVLVALPYVVVLGVIGLYWAVQRLPRPLALAAWVLVFATAALPFSLPEPVSAFPQLPELDGTVMSSDPRAGLQLDNRLVPYYYGFTDALGNYEPRLHASSAIIHRPASFPCRPSDLDCARQKAALAELALSQAELIMAEEGVYVFSVAR